MIKENRLTEIEGTRYKFKLRTRAKFICSCGTIKDLCVHYVGKSTFSCGCLHKERVAKVGKANTKHGYTKTKLYDCWYRMCYRTTRDTAWDYKYYGGRGISVCEEWLSILFIIS